MGIPIGFPYGMGMGNFFSLWEFPHVGILWEIVIPTCENPMGIPTEILWEWDGNGNENFLPTATLLLGLFKCYVTLPRREGR